MLAAGVGNRIQPVSDILPKPLLPINGRPIIELVLDSLSAAGIGDVAIVIGHKAKLVKDFVGDGRRFGIHVSFVYQAEQLGTGNAVAAAADFIDDDVVVIASDTAFLDLHVRGTIDLFRRSGAGAALCLKRLPPERLARTSAVELMEDGTITRFVEKPVAGTAPSNYAAALLHVYCSEVRECLKSLRVSPRGEIELPDVLDPLRQRGHRIVGHAFPVPEDLTDAEDLLRLNFDYAARLLDGTAHDCSHA